MDVSILGYIVGSSGRCVLWIVGLRDLKTIVTDEFELDGCFNSSKPRDKTVPKFGGIEI